eukprot:TRINITY_DN8130_c0_g1_i2.p1 TRINITY_DN8130_c0_g1~~TRINITY_DN8130_c0_g1_i2.p1  ORF type:complete len:205 (-),score=37.76 TRINITY_DN8130_c0_g1_i2:106-720(-)
MSIMKKIFLIWEHSIQLKTFGGFYFFFFFSPNFCQIVVTSRFYTRLAKIPQIPKESNYHLFREGVIPMWETFPKGGCFIKKLKKTEDNTLTRLWEELMIATIGEQFEDPDVVGIVLSIRPKEDVISIWNKDNHNYTLRTKLSDVLRNVWGTEYYSGIEYKNHSVSIKDRSTYRLKSTNSAMSDTKEATENPTDITKSENSQSEK